MSKNKENVRPKSKIPVLKEKIIHRSVLIKNESSNSEVHRTHLGTLANQNVDQNCLAGSSRDVPVDTRFENVHVETVIPGKSVQKGLTPASPSQSVKKKVNKSLKRPNSIGKPEIVSSIATSVPLSLPMLDIATKQANHNLPEIDPSNRHYTLDNLKYLLRTEKKLSDPPGIRTASRACVINWIVKLHIASGCVSVIQQACWYLDKLLCSSTWITSTNIQLVAAACYWIATKFNGIYMTAKRMARYSAHAFAESELISAERHILRKFNFQMVTVVSQDFVAYFSWCCGCAHCTEVEAAASFISLCGVTLDKTLATEYPSVVAAAAVKISLEFLHKTMFMEQLQSSCIYKAADKKATDIKRTCDQLNAAIRMVHSSQQVYKALVGQFLKPPDYIVNKLFKKL